MQTLNEVESVFVVDLYKQAILLPDSIKQVLIEDAPGYYIPGIVKPIINKQDINRINIISKKNPADFFNTSVEELIRVSKVNKNYFREIDIQYGNVTVDGVVFLNQIKNLTTSPNKSIVQMQFVKDLILDNLYQICRQNTHSFGKFYKYIKPEGRDLVDAYNCGDDLRNVLETLRVFIGRHVDYLYFNKEVGTNLIIEKTVDYRVYEYYKLLQKINPPDYS